MSFSSLIFFVFLPLVFALYWIRPSIRWQNSVLLVASYVFYGWWDWRFCFLMLGSSLVDYFGAGAIHRSQAPVRRRILLSVVLAINLTVLGVFKYFNFFADTLAVSLAALGLDVNTVSFAIILPVGISFYTFQTMSYTIDVYRGAFSPQRNLLNYLCFVSFFPQLVAGPIERATQLLPQFQTRRVFSDADARTGLRLMLWGLVKKMIVADNLGPIVDQAYSAASLPTGGVLALATVLFAFQIYCDFSGYSDIAAGVAALFGVRLMRNFAYPYFSKSLTEFWRRWHISLSTWFRDYIYFPLGGNRVRPALVYRNLLVICIISGLWHGAALTFVVWGVLHGIYLVIERASGWHKPPPEDGRWGRARSLLRMLLTFALVCLAWIFFRAASMEEALLIVRKILTAPGPFSAFLQPITENPGAFLSLAGLLVVEGCGRRHWNPLGLEAAPKPIRWIGYSVTIWMILLFGTGRTTEFIYFRF